MPDHGRQKGQETAPDAGALTVLFTILTRSWRFVAMWVFLSVAGATVVSLLITPQFKSTTSVFPSEEADLLGGLEGVSTLAKSLAPRGLGSIGRNTELDRYMAILHSGRVLGAVIKEFDLVSVYEITQYPGERTVKKLLENVEITVEDEGYITISVYDEDPQRAAAMANFFVESLNRTNTEMKVLNAKGNREFIQNRYDENLIDLTAAEDSLKEFQKRFGIVAMPEQVEESIKATSEMAARAAMLEVELATLKRTQSSEHPLVRAAEIEIQELRRKLDQITQGTGLEDGEMKLLIPFAKVPDLGAEYLRRFRDVETQYRILQFLTPLYEQAKVEENRSTPSVLVLDRAYPAERKSRPKRMLIVLGAFFVALISSIAIVAIREKWRSEREANSPVYQAASAFADRVWTDISGFVRRPRRRSS
ncbi:MAG: Wzz/FepE/Etk N-terminal domain-containing protein [Bacteroidota bacterium]